MLPPPPLDPQVELNFEGDQEQLTILLVHDTKPPFLEGKAVGKKVADIVMPLKVRRVAGARVHGP